MKNYLKLFAGILITGLLMSSAQASFSDVYSTDEHYAAIDWLSNQGVVEGYEDGSFSPNNEVTRAEALKIILETFNLSVDSESSAALVFSDVSETDWFFSYVSTGVNSGIINGYSDGTFLPHENVNRAEAMKMMALAAGVSAPVVSEAPYEDVSAAEWYAPYADYAKTWNVEPPELDGLWYAGNLVTRAELAEMAYRMYSVSSTRIAFDESTNWERKDFPTVDLSMKVPFQWYVKQDGVGAMWQLDENNGQISLLQPYENGGTLLMTRYSNPDGLSAGTLWNQMIASGVLTANGATTDQSTVRGYSTLIVNHPEGETLYKEWYVMLQNGSVVHLQGLRGQGAYSDYLESYMELAIDSLEYKSGGQSDLSTDEAVSAIREAIQVDGMGATSRDLLDDWSLIYTDTIGVGTGPVDYYYSPSGDITIKYERSFDVILDVEDGQTTAF